MTTFFDLFRRDPVIREIKAGEAFFHEGDACNGEMYVLVSGEAGIEIKGQLVELAQAGTILGEMSMVDEAPRMATVTARSDCRFAVIDSKRFDFLVSQTPGFAREVMRVMAHRLRHADLMLGDH